MWWKKLGNFLKKNWKKIFIGLALVVVGAVIIGAVIGTAGTITPALAGAVAVGGILVGGGTVLTGATAYYNRSDYSVQTNSTPPNSVPPSMPPYLPNNNSSTSSVISDQLSNSNIDISNRTQGFQKNISHAIKSNNEKMEKAKKEDIEEVENLKKLIENEKVKKQTQTQKSDEKKGLLDKEDSDSGEPDLPKAKTLKLKNYLNSLKQKGLAFKLKRPNRFEIDILYISNKETMDEEELKIIQKLIKFLKEDFSNLKLAETAKIESNPKKGCCIEITDDDFSKLNKIGEFLQRIGDGWWKKDPNASNVFFFEAKKEKQGNVNKNTQEITCGIQ